MYVIVNGRQYTVYTRSAGTLYYVCKGRRVNITQPYVHPGTASRARSGGRGCPGNASSANGGLRPPPPRRDEIVEEICSICLNDINPRSRTIMQLSCQHRFHTACIRGWFRSLGPQRLNRCPTCRAVHRPPREIF
jgi:hypothetical protein